MRLLLRQSSAIGRVLLSAVTQPLRLGDVPSEEDCLYVHHCT